MVMFTAHLSIIVKRLTIQAKNSFGCHFGGHTFALQNGGQILMSIINKSSYFVEKSKCHTISPFNAFPLKNFGRKIIFMCFVNFGISKIPTHFLTKGCIGYMSSWCKWPISANLDRMFHRFFSNNFLYSF